MALALPQFPPMNAHSALRAESPHPLPVLGRYTLPTVPTVGIVSNDRDPTKPCAVETIWTTYMTEPY